MSDRRTTLLDAAITVIARQGIRGLRVEAVAAEAGVAVSLIYYYFQSRPGLIRATLEHANERAASALDEHGTSGDNGRERLIATLLSELGDDMRDTSVVWGEILASAVFDPELREQLREANDTWVRLVAAAIDAGRADGSIDDRVDPGATAARLTALVDGLSARWLAGLLPRDEAAALLAQGIDADLGVARA